MADKHQWSREDEIIALNVYFRVPQPRVRHPEIMRAAEIVGCTTASMVMKLSNFRHLNPEDKCDDLNRPAKLSREVWNEFGGDSRRLRQAVLRIVKERQVPARVSRREVRQAAMRVIYAAQMQNITTAAALESLRQTQTGARDKAVFADLLLRTIVACIDSRNAELTALVRTALGRPLELISEVERAVIVSATAELLSCPQTGGEVVINEAVEIVKQTGATGGHKIVNGVLDAIVAQIRKPAHA